MVCLCVTEWTLFIFTVLVSLCLFTCYTLGGAHLGWKLGTVSVLFSKWYFIKYWVAGNALTNFGVYCCAQTKLKRIFNFASVYNNSEMEDLCDLNFFPLFSIKEKQVSLVRNRINPCKGKHVCHHWTLQTTHLIIRQQTPNHNPTKPHLPQTRH